MYLIELRAPLGARLARSLKVGDQVTLSGTLFSMRDQASARILALLKEGERPPVDLAGAAVFHAGPAIDASGARPRIVSIGPTTSARMDAIIADLIRLLGVRCVIGKGGLGDEALKEMGRKGCVYASAVGGCAALYTRAVKEVHRVFWKEMGPEALYELGVDRLGPLIITMDSHGQSLHRDLAIQVEARLRQLLAHRRQI